MLLSSFNIVAVQNLYYFMGIFSTGYSIFVIRGNLPECEAEQILRFMRVQQQQRPRLIGEEEAQTSAGYRF